MPRLGQRYLAPLDAPGPKTGRRYAAVVARLRALPDGAVFTAAQAGASREFLTWLAGRGELEVAIPGRAGRHGSRPPYFRRRHSALP
jgi:hypothetical protein